MSQPPLRRVRTVLMRGILAIVGGSVWSRARGRVRRGARGACPLASFYQIPRGRGGGAPESNSTMPRWGGRATASRSTFFERSSVGRRPTRRPTLAGPDRMGAQVTGEEAAALAARAVPGGRVVRVRPLRG